MTTRLFNIDPWIVGTSELRHDNIRLIESITSTGNGHMGMRGNFDEGYGGDSHQGTYIAGVWFPDKTRVGWWKNGYPLYFGKVINAMNLIAVPITANNIALDTATAQIQQFSLELDMRTGVLRRAFHWHVGDGTVLALTFERYLSITTPELLEQRIQITAVHGAATVTLSPQLDGDVHNLDSNYGEQFWVEKDRHAGETSVLTTETRPNTFGTPQFSVTAASRSKLMGAELSGIIDGPFTVGTLYEGTVSAGTEADTITLEKTTAVLTSRDVPEKEQDKQATHLLAEAYNSDWEAKRASNDAAWAARWERSDIAISGDDATQQGIRYNLFQLFSTYYGEDPHLNIGPKGFTGEKYGGATYWDTEAYLVPFYLAVAKPEVARSLLQYRHDQLPQAQHNARQQGLAGALFPMVTFTGVECHNEWEITFEEIHRNGAIAWAIYYYTEYTGDRSYIENDGLEVLIEISRFWADRVHYSRQAGAWMIHGVTGPNEYENNVNNNWYTNYLAAWVLRYTAELLNGLSADKRDPSAAADEIAHWLEIADGMYLPHDDARGIAVQHDTFLDKDLVPVAELDPAIRPLNKHWSWDRILRSPYIKQADVLQGMYFFENHFDVDEIARNFEFYEPLTVHESSLSASIHAVLAARIGDRDRTVSFSTHTARLDLDNYNDDTDDGLHITSMSGGWLAIVQGFAGMRVYGGRLSFAPFCPPDWDDYAFTINYRGSVIRVEVDAASAQFTRVDGDAAMLWVGDVEYALDDQVTVRLA